MSLDFHDMWFLAPRLLEFRYKLDRMKTPCNPIGKIEIDFKGSQIS